MKKFLFDTWYGALVVLAVVSAMLLGFTVVDGVLGVRSNIAWNVLSISLFLVWIAACVTLLAAFVVSLVKRRWLRALLQVLLGGLLLCGFLMALVVVCFMGMFSGPSDDHFADELAIPAELESDIVIPGDQVGSPFDSADVYDDDFARAVFAALSKEGGDDPTVTCDLSALSELVHSRRDELMAYLARHPGWWLHEDGGRLCATRRWRNKGIWNHQLHGYYSGNTTEHDFAQDFGVWQKTTHYQTRTTIGFPFSPFGRNRGAEREPISTAKADVTRGNLESFSSDVRFGDKDFCVEVFEESPARERRITNAVLVYLKDEFQSLTNLPPDAVVRGSDEFTLRNSIQPGIYNLTLRINPGEPGIVYLKAFEATKGTRLSEGRLKGASNERIGWSNDPEEKFLYENGFTIYEGDWGKPYAARIEVWFRPDTGKPERKLTERICKIEGWQR